MKLSTIAIAIAAATVSFSASAEIDLGGMARSTYNGSGNERFETKVELNLDASGKGAFGLTYFGHAQLEGTGSAAGKGTAGTAPVLASADYVPATPTTPQIGHAAVPGVPASADYVPATGNNTTTDDIYVGVKGGFGQVIIGDTDGGCDATDVGGYPDYISDVGTGGCSGSDQNNITYLRTVGVATYAISYSPENNDDNISVGAKAKLGPATVSLGHTAGDGVADTTTLGIAGSYGPVGLGFRVSDEDGVSDNAWVAHASYAAGANSFALGVNEPGDVSAYWNRNLGANTTFGIDISDPDVGSTEVALRLQKAF